jgi:hypothetical protein
MIKLSCNIYLKGERGVGSKRLDLSIRILKDVKGLRLKVKSLPAVGRAGRCCPSP